MVDVYPEGDTDLPAPLGSYLRLASSDSVTERISGFRRLGDYWDSRPRVMHGGFSDTPIDSVSGTEHPAPSDDHVEAIARAIEKGLHDVERAVREAAAKSLCTTTRSLPAVTSAIEAGLKSDDATVVWYVGQQAVRTPPALEAVKPALLHLLASEDFNKSWTAVELLREYGTKAKPFSDQIVERILKAGESDRELRCTHCAKAA